MNLAWFSCFKHDIERRFTSPTCVLSAPGLRPVIFTVTGHTMECYFSLQCWRLQQVHLFPLHPLLRNLCKVRQQQRWCRAGIILCMRPANAVNALRILQRWSFGPAIIERWLVLTISDRTENVMITEVQNRFKKDNFWFKKTLFCCDFVFSISQLIDWVMCLWFLQKNHSCNQ